MHSNTSLHASHHVSGPLKDRDCATVDIVASVHVPLLIPDFWLWIILGLSIHPIINNGHSISHILSLALHTHSKLLSICILIRHSEWYRLPADNPCHSLIRQNAIKTHNPLTWPSSQKIWNTYLKDEWQEIGNECDNDQNGTPTHRIGFPPLFLFLCIHYME